LGNNEIEKAIRAIMKDSDLKAQLIEKVVEKATLDTDAVDDIVEEIADILEDDPDFTNALARKILTSEDTRDLVVTKLIEELQ